MGKVNKDKKPLNERDLVYFDPKMNDVTINKNIAYKNFDNQELNMDLYYPSNKSDKPNFSAVIFVFGYSGSLMMKNNNLKLKDWQQYKSWAKLVASRGIIGITYETEEPKVDILDLVDYIHKKAESLKINKKKIGIWSCSANVPTALYLLIKETKIKFKCTVLFYGFMFNLENSNDVSLATENFGASYPIINYKIKDLPHEIPILVIRAGLDEIPFLNNSIDFFISQALLNNIPITIQNYSKGHHVFDIKDDKDSSRYIIKQSINFMKLHLNQ